LLYPKIIYFEESKAKLTFAGLLLTPEIRSATFEGVMFPFGSIAYTWFVVEVLCAITFLMPKTA
jgi:hypothetical protein